MEKTKILIVEDEAVISMHIKNSLAKLGYEVCGCVSSGEEAISISSKLKPDLILMDIVLQGRMDGIEAAKIIKNTLGIPVVYLTGNADVQTITRARETSPYGYVLKPVNVLHMFSTIDTVLHRHDLELRLAENEEKFRAISEHILEGIALTVDFKNVWVNESFAGLFGYTKEEMLGRGPELVVHPDDMPGLMQKGLDMIQGLEFGYSRLRAKRKDGSEIIIEIMGRLFRLNETKAILLIVRDITERKIAEDALRDSEEKFRGLVHSLQDIIIIMDAKGVIIFENPATVEILGYSLMGKNGFDIVHPDDLKTAMTAFGEVVDKTNKHRPTMIRVRHADGTWLYLDALGSNMFDNKSTPGILLVCRNVTKRIETQTALRESEQRYHTLFDQSPAGVFLFDRNLIITECNERFAEIVGDSREKIIGFESEKQRETSVIIPMKETIAGRPSSWEGWFKPPFGDRRMYHVVNYRPLRDAEGQVIGGIAVVQDITDRKIAEEQLKQSEERNRLLVENANEIIAVLQDRRFVFTNPQFTKLTGFSQNELGSRDFTEFVHQDDRRIIEERYRRRMNGDRIAFTYELRFISKDGTIKWVELNSVLFTWEDKPAVLLFIRDITERKQAEEERRRIESQIQQTQKLESLGVLAGGIAHDFNNLLMAILGNIDLALLELMPSSPARGNLVEAAKASQRAAELCRQMLAYSGRGQFKSESLDLNEIIEDMSHMLEVSISKKAMLRYDYASGLPAIIADATQMRQIIMNLVINASDAIGEKSGIISISTGIMDCDQSYLSETWLNEKLPEGHYVYFEVADTGCGIDREMLPKIFDPFFTTKFAGRGLGLAAVFGIVRRHKGAIKVYSEKGRGTTFKILLPPSEEAAGHVDGIQINGQEWQGNGTILFADDEETIRSLGRQMLERLGFTVLTAANGREALDLYRSRAGEIDCVILDLTMPHMDGEEAFRELRRADKNVRVIMSSGYNEQEITQRFAGKGIAGFIQKPYQLVDLAAKLKEILG